MSQGSVSSAAASVEVRVIPVKVYDVVKYKAGIDNIDAKCPIAEELKEMAKSGATTEEMPELACMLLEVAAFEKRVCQYCHAVGHKR